jgi:hypothetical protein
MKKIFNYKLFPIYIIVLIIIFFILHILIFLNHTSGDLFPLQSSAETPIITSNLSVLEPIKPNYLHPFRKFEYQYQAHIKSGGYETVLIEQAESIFSTKMVAIKGEPAAYLGPDADKKFWRDFAVNSYPNYLFFITQYLIISLSILFFILYLKYIIKNRF